MIDDGKIPSFPAALFQSPPSLNAADLHDEIKRKRYAGKLQRKTRASCKQASKENLDLRPAPRGRLCDRPIYLHLMGFWGLHGRGEDREGTWKQMVREGRGVEGDGES